MTIERVMGGFTGFDITCEICDQTEYLDFDWESFREAVAEAKTRGWKAYKDEDGQWCHICWGCQKKEAAEGGRR
jgi:hypothetical protein